MLVPGVLPRLFCLPLAVASDIWDHQYLSLQGPHLSAIHGHILSNILRLLRRFFFKLSVNQRSSWNSIL